MRLGVTAAACALLALAGGCGDDDDDTDAGAGLQADLVVTVRPEGADGPATRRSIRCERLGSGSDVCRGLAGLQPEQFDPVPRDVACAEIYGGPATARVRGELRGTVVDARFSRTDGCQIERWDRNRVLLGD